MGVGGKERQEGAGLVTPSQETGETHRDRWRMVLEAGVRARLVSTEYTVSPILS